jgi:hypothetical protein
MSAFEVRAMQLVEKLARHKLPLLDSLTQFYTDGTLGVQPVIDQLPYGFCVATKKVDRSLNFGSIDRITGER